jgi:hypothetical protein
MYHDYFEPENECIFYELLVHIYYNNRSGFFVRFDLSYYVMSNSIHK